MVVERLNFMGSDLSVVNAARVSFDKQSTWSFGSYPDLPIGVLGLKEEDKKLIKYLAKHNHWTPFAHTSVTFRITMPIYVARQLAKHQVGGVVNEVSRRYIKSKPVLDVPTEWRKSAENVKQGSSDELVEHNAQKEIEAAMSELVELYEALLEVGVCPEQARAVLPLCTETTWVWTGSLMFFARVCKLRLDPHAQRETKAVAEEIARRMEQIFPVSWAALMGTETNE